MAWKKMNPTWKKKWITALESGKFRQGTGALRVPGYKGNHAKFCCLGVLCTIDPNETMIYSKDDLQYSIDNEQGDLSERLLKKYGLTEETQSKLIQLNDGTGPETRHTFKEIAKFIREKL